MSDPKDLAADDLTSSSTEPQQETVSLENDEPKSEADLTEVKENVTEVPVPVAEITATEEDTFVPTPEPTESVAPAAETSVSEPPTDEVPEVVATAPAEEPTPELTESNAAAETSVSEPPIDEVPEVVATAPAEEPVAEALATPDEPHDESSEHPHDDEHEPEEEKDFSQYTRAQLVEASEQLLAENNFRKIDLALRAIKNEIDRLNRADREAALQVFEADGGDPESFEYKQDELITKFYANYKQLKDRKAKYFAEIEKKKQKSLEDKHTLLAHLKTIVDSGDTSKASLDKIKEVQKSWKESGAVPSQEADELYRSYNALLDRFYNQRSMENELMELDRRRNLVAKTEICEKAEALLTAENINESINTLNKLHEDYKSIGPVPKDEQEAVWQRFKAASDKLYERKRAHAEETRKALEENMRRKQELCVSIEPFAEFASEKIADWNTKTKEILALQTAWEKVGPAPREVAKDINKQFWANFKAFFANKGRFFDKLEKFREENLQKKVSLCEQAEALQESSEWDSTSDKLKVLQDEWKLIGPVPEAQRDSIYERFKAACDHFFNRKRNRRNDQDREFDANLAKKREICEQIDAMTKAQDGDVEKFEELYDKFGTIGFVPRKQMNTIQDKFAKAVDGYLASLQVSDEEREDIRASLHLRDKDPNADKKNIRKEQVLRKKLANLENDISLWKNNVEFFANSKSAAKLREEFNGKIKAAEQEVVSLKAQLKAMRNAGK
jgi:hypothetical protein